MNLDDFRTWRPIGFIPDPPVSAEAMRTETWESRIPETMKHFRMLINKWSHALFVRILEQIREAAAEKFTLWEGDILFNGANYNSDPKILYEILNNVLRHRFLEAGYFVTDTLSDYTSSHAAMTKDGLKLHLLICWSLTSDFLKPVKKAKEPLCGWAIAVDKEIKPNDILLAGKVAQWRYPHYNFFPERETPKETEIPEQKKEKSDS